MKGSGSKVSQVIRVLCDILGEEHLEHLILKGNSLGNELIPVFATLSNNKKVQEFYFIFQLKELDIRSNFIGDHAAIALANALAQNPALKMLKWDDNSISLDGWQAVCNVMNKNKTLIRIEYPEKVGGNFFIVLWEIRGSPINMLG